MHSWVPFGQGQELGILRRAKMSHHGDQFRMSTQHAFELVRSRNPRAWNGAAAHVNDHWDGCVCQHPPHLVQRIFSQVESADLRVNLEHPRASLECRKHLVHDAALGEEGCARDTVWFGGRQGQGKVGEVGRHAGPVCVCQCSEAAYPHLAQVRQPALLVPAIRDRPRASDQGPHLVEVGPHPAQHSLGQEVGVDVDQPR